MSAEDNPWHMSAEREKEWFAEQAMQRASIEQTPEYKKRVDEINRIADVLSLMAYPEMPFEKRSRNSTVYFLGKATSTTKPENTQDDGMYKKRSRLHQALQWYGRYFRGKPAKEITKEHAYESLGEHRKE